MTALAHAAKWLRCPHCSGPLQVVDRSLLCAERHAFDVAKQGYVNLMGRAQGQNADTADMVAARDRFLAAGHYVPVAEAVAAATAGAESVLEVGAGTGHYLARALHPEAWGLATDVSVPAMRRAAKAHPRMAAVVADTWAGLPVLDHTMDAVLCIFAPRNLEEFKRVLKPGGKLVIVVPNPGHLIELREQHGLLDIAEDKAQQLTEALPRANMQRIHFTLDLDEQAATDLVGMGPNAHHGSHRISAGFATVDVALVQATLEQDFGSGTVAPRKG